MKNIEQILIFLFIYFLVMTFFILHIKFFLNSSFSTLSKHSSARILTNFNEF
jgi:hypothetical protein